MGAAAWALRHGRCGGGGRPIAGCSTTLASAAQSTRCSRVTLRAPDVDEAGGCQFFLAILRHTLNDGKGPTASPAAAAPRKAARGALTPGTAVYAREAMRASCWVAL